MANFKNEMSMIIESDKYMNESVMYGKNLVTFTNFKAEVSDEIGEFILNSRYAHVFAEGQAPKTKSQVQKLLEDNVSDRDALWKREVDRLEGVVRGLKVENEKLKHEVTVWKGEVERLTAKKSEPETNVQEENVQQDIDKDELMKQLSSYKKDELIAAAKDLGITDEELNPNDRVLTKKEIVDLIFAKA